MYADAVKQAELMEMRSTAEQAEAALQRLGGRKIDDNIIESEPDDSDSSVEINKI